MMLTYSQRKSFARAGAAGLDATVKESVQAVEAMKAAEHEANRANYAKRHAPVPYTREELEAATHIRTLIGWHKVVRVSAKTVTVETGYSWTDRHPIAKILEVRVLPSEGKNN